MMQFVSDETINHFMEKNAPHFPKGTSGIKQKCTQSPTPFLDTVFHALSRGVIHFVKSVSSKNLEIKVSDWL